MATRPSLHAWVPDHCTMSEMSSLSCCDNSFPTPSERPQPRRSALTTAKPCGTHHAGSGPSQPVNAENVTGSGWRSAWYCTEYVQRLPRRAGRLSLP